MAELREHTRRRTNTLCQQARRLSTQDTYLSREITFHSRSLPKQLVRTLSRKQSAVRSASTNSNVHAVHASDSVGGIRHEQQ